MAGVCTACSVPTARLYCGLTPAPPPPPLRVTVPSLRSSPSSASICSQPLLEALEQELTCMICRDTYVHPVFLQCGHTFCCECLAAYFRTGRVKKICPLCKIHVRPKDAQPNLLAARLVVLVSSPNVA